MNKEDLNLYIKISAIIAILLVAFSIFYFFVVYLPGKDRIILNQKQQQNWAEQQRAEKEKEIRAYCYKIAADSATETYKEKSKDNPYLPKTENFYLYEDFDEAYKNCLRSNGLDK